MRTCDLCRLPRPPGEPPLPDNGRSERVDWHPRHVQQVHPYPLVDFGAWGCSRCGRSFPVEASWAVDHRLSPDNAVRTFVVCPDCAKAVRPARLRVDVKRAVTSDHPSLRDLVTFVAAQRRVRRGSLLLRAEDTRHIAASEDRPVREVVAELQAAGLAEVI